MESRVEDRNHGGVRHQGLAGKDAGQVCRVVERCKVRDLADGLEDAVIDDNRLCELLAAVDNAVSDGTDLVQVPDDAALHIGQGIEHQADGLLVVLDLGNGLLLAQVIAHVLIGDGAVNADSLAQALCQNASIIGADDLELQGRTAAVDNKDVHFHSPIRILFSRTKSGQEPFPAPVHFFSRSRYSSCAWTAVRATTPTMSCQLQPLERSFTGFAMPCSIGP